MDFAVHLTVDHTVRVKAALAPISRMMIDLVAAANAAGAIDVPDVRRAAALMQQTIMYSWFGNRLVENTRMRLTAEATWEFCLHGLGVAPVGLTATAPAPTRRRRAGRAGGRSRSRRACA